MITGIGAGERVSVYLCLSFLTRGEALTANFIGNDETGWGGTTGAWFWPSSTVLAPTVPPTPLMCSGPANVLQAAQFMGARIWVPHDLFMGLRGLAYAHAYVQGPSRE